MDRSPLVVGLAAVFAGMTALLLVLSAVLQDVVILFLALPFAAVTYLFWYHASGRIRSGIHKRARRQRARRQAREDRRDTGGFGAGPRFGGARTRSDRQARAGGGANRQRRVAERVDSGPSRREAYATLGLEAGAGDAAIRRAYRRKVKDVHPDRGGDEQEFKAVTAAYERLTD